MSRRPIQSSVRSHAPDENAPAEQFQQQVREAFSYWAGGVAVVAAREGGTVDAITATSFSTLSLDPPLLLVCVGEQAGPLPMIRATGRFTVSVLAGHQRRTASVMADRMPGRQTLFHADGAPIVAGALVALTCTLWNDYPGGDHRIIVGEVMDVAFGDGAGPLLYYRRGYRVLE